MIIDFKGEYKFQERLLQLKFFNQFSQDKEWTLSMDIVQGNSGQCPLSPWTLRCLSGLPGLCPEYPWTLSRLSTDSMDNVQGDHGHCPGKPWNQWTLYRREIYRSEGQLFLDPRKLFVAVEARGVASLFRCVFYIT